MLSIYIAVSSIHARSGIKISRCEYLSFMTHKRGIYFLWRLKWNFNNIFFSPSSSSSSFFLLLLLLQFFPTTQWTHTRIKSDRLRVSKYNSHGKATKCVFVYRFLFKILSLRKKKKKVFCFRVRSVYNIINKMYIYYDQYNIRNGYCTRARRKTSKREIATCNHSFWLFSHILIRIKRLCER